MTEQLFLEWKRLKEEHLGGKKLGVQFCTCSFEALITHPSEDGELAARCRSLDFRAVFQVEV